MELSSDDEQSASQNHDDDKKRKLEKGMLERNGDIDLEEEDGEDYRIIPADKSRRGTRGSENWARRSGRVKKPVSYAGKAT